jgi:putative colanic acid biosynthesis UDP-glucose lipid carrier transferase
MSKNLPIRLNAPTHTSSFSDQNLTISPIYISKLFRRLFDIIFSLLVFIFILTWLCPLLAILIRLESKGPAFFIQERIGFKKMPFKCYKFRSMRLNQEADIKEASHDDDRITKMGSFLRRTCLDELPQFFNVLIGDMTIVGPRPQMTSQAKRYENLTDKFEERQSVKPGLTGWAQISGSRGKILSDDEMTKRIEADLWYLKNWSFALDIKIIFLTLSMILKGNHNNS